MGEKTKLKSGKFRKNLSRLKYQKLEQEKYFLKYTNGFIRFIRLLLDSLQSNISEEKKVRKIVSLIRLELTDLDKQLATKSKRLKKYLKGSNRNNKT